jgi:RNA polymerase sigma-70 factor (ECF subfamily)
MTWNEVAGRYGELVRRVVRTLIRDEALALDVSQEALLKIGRAFRHPEGAVEDPEAWVITVARNAARDALRRKTRRREVAIDNDIVDERRPETLLLQDESRERVARALEALPAAARRILLLKFRDGRSGPQIAEDLGISLEAAWQQVSRAMKLLRTYLTESP